MDLFYIIVLSVATVLLILLLTYIGILMKNAKTSDDGEVFPPVASSCPDYWSSSISDPSSCNIPNNGAGIKNLGSIYDVNGLVLNDSNTIGYDLAKNVINFNDTRWSSGGKIAVCAKKDWANKYNIMWDGVSNYNSC
jgi:hypothetical protein